MKCVVKVMIKDENGLLCMGPGICSLLKAIAEVGNVALAAKDLGISYSKCWKMIRNAEDATGYKLLDRVSGGTSGGHASLTSEGALLLQAFERVEKDISQYADSRFREIMQSLAEKAD